LVCKDYPGSIHTVSRDYLGSRHKPKVQPHQPEHRVSEMGRHKLNVGISIDDKQGRQNMESIEWVAIEKMLADPLTRWGVDTTALRTVLRTGRWERPT